jgi:AI-2 transport protein TqsA
MATSPPASTNKALTVLVAIIATLLLGWLLVVAGAILQPLVIAVLLSNILQPVVRAMALVRIPAWFTVVGLILLLIWALTEGGALFYREVSAFLAAGGPEAIKAQLTEAIKIQDPPGRETLLRMIEDLGKGQQTPFGEMLGTATGFARGSFLVLLYMLFIFAEQAIFREKVISVSQRPERAEAILDTIGYGIQRYLGVKTVTSLATGVLCFTVLQFMQLPYAPLWGFLTFLLNYIPTFGSITAALPPLAVSIAQGEGFTNPLIIAATYLTVNIVLGSILEPRMLGRELNLSPLVILISVVVWAGLWGVPGMFLAVPLTATAQIIMANIESTRPIAVLLGNGPPRRRPLGRRGRRRTDAPLADDDESLMQAPRD